jgi:hypothetical protein
MKRGQDLEAYPYRPFRTPAYRYLRAADRLPSTEAALEAGMDARVIVHIFNPTGSGDWYVTGYDPETRIVSGAASLGYGVELGDSSMAELVEFRGRFGLPLERDLHWTPKPIRDLIR